MAVIPHRNLLTTARGLGVSLLLLCQSHAQPYFTEATDEPVRAPRRGVQSTAIADCDNDGWPDLLLVEYDGPVTLWHNEAGRAFYTI